jgi:hypothetical protein
MKTLKNALQASMSHLEENNPQLKKEMRINQVREMWQEIITHVYKDKGQLFLSHTNNVYLLTKDQIRTLIVYVDDSIFAAELNAQRELIKLKFRQKYNEQIDEFNIYVSRGKYKNNYPYQKVQPQQEKTSQKELPELNKNEEEEIKKLSSKLENKKVQASFSKALEADLRRNKEKMEK